MAQLPDASVDMILCDLPYGTTACKWDTVIPFEPLWAQYRRVAKRNAAIVLTASQPFTTALIASNMREFKHCWVWDKGVAANFVQAKRMPLKTAEDVAVFCPRGATPAYYPQMVARDKPVVRKLYTNGSESIPIRGPKSETWADSTKVYSESYPNSILSFSSRTAGSRGLHPTQKPVALMEYLIRTYTREGETVLDNCMGSGTTGVACANTGRDFIGIERDDKYFAIASERIAAAQRSEAA
jgi:site-specific DNA-methyltransferase (adenine-specific)